MKNKISNLMNIKFDSKPVYGDSDNYIQTKIRLYEETISTNFIMKRKKKYQKKIYHKTVCH